jgi:hypothetical protein
MNLFNDFGDSTLATVGVENEGRYSSEKTLFIVEELAKIDSEERRVKRLLEVVNEEKKRLKEAKDFLLDSYDIGTREILCEEVRQYGGVSYYMKNEDGSLVKMYEMPNYGKLQIMYKNE